MSGGIDSSYLLHLVKKVMDLDPLVVHVDAGWNSEEAEHNIRVMVQTLGLTLVTHKIDWEEMKDLQIAYLKSALANQDVPQDHAFFAKLYETACEHQIKYVITRSNLTSESILPAAWGYDAMDACQLKAVHKRFGRKKTSKLP